MRVFTCIDHDSHWPVGCSSVIAANDETEATRLLDDELKKCGLRTSAAAPYTLIELSLDAPKAVVLNDGEY